MEHPKKRLPPIKLKDDPPFDHIVHYTISFLSTPVRQKRPQDPNEMEKYRARQKEIDVLEALEVVGFRVYNGYVNKSSATDDVPRIREEINDMHDVVVGDLGKIHPWNDLNRTEKLVYDDKKMNDLEVSRKERDDKVRLVKRQMENERAKAKESASSVRDRLRKKLYERGEVYVSPVSGTQEQKSLVDLADHQAEIDLVFQTDHLPDVETRGLEWGLISFYTPKHIVGLKDFCFKVRGLFANQEDALLRKALLEKANSWDRIYLFPLGKWCPYSDNYSTDPSQLLPRLNFLMNDYLEMLRREKAEFEERKEKMINNPDCVGSRKLTRREKKRLAEAESAREEDVSDSAHGNRDQEAISQLKAFIDE